MAESGPHGGEDEDEDNGAEEREDNGKGEGEDEGVSVTLNVYGGRARHNCCICTRERRALI